MRGYEVVYEEKLKGFIRRSLGVKKSDGVELGVEYLAMALSALLRYNCVESAMNVHALADDTAGSWNRFRREVRKLIRLVWKETRSPMFARLYSQPNTENIFCMLAAKMVTKPDLLRKRDGYIELPGERIARTEIARYIHPETVRTTGRLTAYFFMIDSCEGALSGAKKGVFYTHELKKACPPVTAKQVEALFKAQADWWDVDTGELFARPLPNPLPSEIWYHIRNCMCERAKKQKNFF